MRAHEAAIRLNVSIKALRHYESIDLIRPSRLPNGYRDYSDHDLDAVRQIVELTALGLKLESIRPFVECLRRGHAEGDDCVESLVAYRDEIVRLDALVAGLIQRRNELEARLNEAACRGFQALESKHETALTDIPTYDLPKDLPKPTDDGSADHLTGRHLPNLALPASDGKTIRLASVSRARWVLFIYPMIGVPGQDMPVGWDSIPGARGCTAEACGFRDLAPALRAMGVRTFGLSVQSSAYQQELARRLHLPYSMLSDERRALGAALGLPTFEVEDCTFYKRLTMILRGAVIEHTFFPVFQPNEHAARVLEWLRGHPKEAQVRPRR